jgi:hypothetical protein
MAPFGANPTPKPSSCGIGGTLEETNFPSRLAQCEARSEPANSRTDDERSARRPQSTWLTTSVHPFAT